MRARKTFIAGFVFIQKSSGQPPRPGENGKNGAKLRIGSNSIDLLV